MQFKLNRDETLKRVSGSLGESSQNPIEDSTLASLIILSLILHYLPRFKRKDNHDFEQILLPICQVFLNSACLCLDRLIKKTDYSSAKIRFIPSFFFFFFLLFFSLKQQGKIRRAAAWHITETEFHDKLSIDFEPASHVRTVCFAVCVCWCVSVCTTERREY